MALACATPLALCLRSLAAWPRHSSHLPASSQCRNNRPFRLRKRHKPRLLDSPRKPLPRRLPGPFLGLRLHASEPNIKQRDKHVSCGRFVELGTVATDKRTELRCGPLALAVGAVRGG